MSEQRAYTLETLLEQKLNGAIHTYLFERRVSLEVLIFVSSEGSGLIRGCIVGTCKSGEGGAEYDRGPTDRSRELGRREVDPSHGSHD